MYLKISKLAEILKSSDSSIYRLVFLYQVNAIKIGNARMIITKTDMIAALKDFEINGIYFKNRAEAMKTDVIAKIFGNSYTEFENSQSNSENKFFYNYFEPKELACKLKVSSTHIFNLIKRRELKAERILKRYRILLETVRDYLKVKQTLA